MIVLDKSEFDALDRRLARVTVPVGHRLCIRGEHAVPVAGYTIATLVCDRCIVAREMERRELLGGKHPDLDGKGSGGKLRHVPSAKALRIISKIILAEVASIKTFRESGSPAGTVGARLRPYGKAA